ncbi:MAG: hypothetical protein ACK4UN_07885, partial [Limisphaerales bacterium]
GVKLVNDLDLVVTNMVTGDVYYGNHFNGGGSFSSVNAVAFTNVVNGERDVVNNVENVYINGPLDGEYAVSVIGRRVNVNAVTAQADAIKQDYALVISIGDLTITNALTITNTVSNPVVQQPNFLSLTNMESITPGQGFSFAYRLGERVGANNPYELSTNGT